MLLSQLFERIRTCGGGAARVRETQLAFPELFARVRTGVFHINFLVGGQRVASGSAFTAHGKLITNNHVFRGPPASDVVIRSVASDPERLEDGFKIPYSRFSQRLVAGSDENGYDFAVLDVPELLAASPHQFTFGSAGQRQVGASVAFLGYPLEHMNLVFHVGIISSIYRTGSTQVIQIDGSVNSSNSGGPLLAADTGEVIGIITRKATGLSRMFQDLMQSFQNNIEVLERSKGFIRVSGLDPVDALVASQHQMKRVAAEIERSANVGIGYAFSAEHVSAEAVLQNA